jgi:ATP diphosphatase
MMLARTDPKHSLNDLLEIMRTMRDKKSGCAWTKDQTWGTLVHHTVEEAYEIVDAVESNDIDGVKGELADMLNQIIFYSQIADENGFFNFDDVICFLSQKLIMRHPNVFSEDDSDKLSIKELESQWERIKAQERIEKSHSNTNKKNDSVLDEVAMSLPALSRAQKIQHRASMSGFDWSDIGPVYDKLDEEVLELKEAVQHNYPAEDVLGEIGDVMFTCVNLIRHLGANAETVMRKSTEKFESRFRSLELIVRSQDKEIKLLSNLELDDLWNKVKS